MPIQQNKKSPSQSDETVVKLDKTLNNLYIYGQKQAKKLNIKSEKDVNALVRDARHSKS